MKNIWMQLQHNLYDKRAVNDKNKIKVLSESYFNFFKISIWYFGLLLIDKIDIFVKQISTVLKKIPPINWFQ